MLKEITKPSWYHDEFYSKDKTPEEWLYELWKRNQFKQGEIGLSRSIYELSMQEQEKYFIEFIFNQESEKFLNIFLEAIPPQPIIYPTISDVLIMHHLLTNSDWYKNHPKRDAFESALPAIINKETETLSKEQKIAFLEIHKTPWCVFHEHHQEESWCPIKEMGYLSGIPLSLNPGYSREDTASILKTKLQAWVGKLQGIHLQFDRWQESKILAVFDLMLWFKIRKFEYTNISLHSLIWPNGRVSKATGIQVNPYDDIDHSISLANRVIDDSPISSLLNLCNARKFKKEMIDS